MTIIYVLITLIGGIFAPQASIADSVLCLQAETPYVCAVEFADNVPYVGEKLQDSIRSHRLEWSLHYASNGQLHESVTTLFFDGPLG